MKGKPGTSSPFQHHLTKKQVRNNVLTYNFPGDEDPRLWLPDQILGAYGDALGESGHFKKWVDKWKSVADDIEVIEIGL